MRLTVNNTSDCPWVISGQVPVRRHFRKPATLRASGMALAEVPRLSHKSDPYTGWLMLGLISHFEQVLGDSHVLQGEPWQTADIRT